MKVWHVSIAALAVVLGCSATSQQEGPDSTGQVQLKLIGTDSQGTQYRLRNATFDISGYPEFGEGDGVSGTGGYFMGQLSSETDPNAPVLTQRVVPGYYYVNFTSTDWYLEEITAEGVERVDEAVLLSSRYQAGYVYDGGTTTYPFRFGVGGELIDFRSGDLEISIEIERPGDPSVAGRGGASGMGGFPVPGGAAPFGGASVQ